MYNPYLPQLAKIKKISRESFDTILYTFEFIDKKKRQEFTFLHGQFLMAGIPGFGDAPFDICSSPYEKGSFDLAIRQVGGLTKKFHELKISDVVTIRGPFGNGFPLLEFENKNFLLISGGCGFVTMRSFILDYLKGRLNPQNKMQVFYGCLNEKSLLFKKEYGEWQKKIDLELILDQPSSNWQGARGLITLLFNQKEIVKEAVAFLCGPPVMYKFVIQKLKEHNFRDEEIYLSLERRMHCGVGVCQHCAVGSKYVCRDGPVFSWAELKDIPSAV